MSDTELTTVTSCSEKSKSLKMYSHKSIKALNAEININASKVKFSNEITVFFVDSNKNTINSHLNTKNIQLISTQREKDKRTKSHVINVLFFNI